jgi:hypothetical protein
MDGENGGGASRTTDPAAGSSSATDVSLHEHLIAIISGDRRYNAYRDTMERTLRIESVAVLVAFGAFAWSQVQRRLEILNHENERLLQQQRNTVSQDTYSANEEQRKSEQLDLTEWRKEVDKDRTTSISREEFQQDNRVQRQGIFDNNAKIAMLAVTVASILITFFVTRQTQTPAKFPITPTVITTTTITP